MFSRVIKRSIHMYTSNKINGYKITKNKGIVITQMNHLGANIFQSIGVIQRKASEIDCNAVINIRIKTHRSRYPDNNLSNIIIYGDAVNIEPDNTTI